MDVRFGGGNPAFLLDVGTWWHVVFGKWVIRVDLLVHSSLRCSSAERGKTPASGNTVSDIFIFSTHLFFSLFSLLSWWKYEIQMKENFGAIHSSLKFNLYFLSCGRVWN